MTLPLENVELFIDHFEEVVREMMTPEDMAPEQAVDLKLSFKEIFTSGENRMKLPRLKRILEQFEPHGPGNMKPVFLAENVYAADMRILKGEHLKLTVVQPDSDVALEAIGFGMAEKQDEVASGLPFDMVFTLETNRWNGKEILQLNIKDIRATV
jgi:single-stranded-DNA-specific exonuclease